jgi:hypothetical protein
MHVARCSFVRLPGIGRIAVVPVIASFFFAQMAASEAQAPANAVSQPSCASGADMDIPVASTIQAKVTGLLDSGHLKVGKDIWVNVINGLTYPGCKLNAGAALYAHVTAAVAQKTPGSAELSLAFDRADCEGHGKKQMPLRLIGLMAPPDTSARMHDEVPVGLKGGTRNAATTAMVTNEADYQLNPRGAPNTVHPGVVVGLPKMNLEVAGGPGCSARIGSTERSVQLEPGSVLILVVQSGP